VKRKRQTVRAIAGKKEIFTSRDPCAASKGVKISPMNIAKKYLELYF